MGFRFLIAHDTRHRAESSSNTPFGSKDFIPHAPLEFSRLAGKKTSVKVEEDVARSSQTLVRSHRIDELARGRNCCALRAPSAPSVITTPLLTLSPNPDPKPHRHSIEHDQGEAPRRNHRSARGGYDKALPVLQDERARKNILKKERQRKVSQEDLKGTL